MKSESEVSEPIIHKKFSQGIVFKKQSISGASEASKSFSLYVFCLYSSFYILILFRIGKQHEKYRQINIGSRNVSICETQGEVQEPSRKTIRLDSR